MRALNSGGARPPAVLSSSDIVVYRPENVTLISGATRGEGVGIHACSVIFGTFIRRSPVLSLQIISVSASAWILSSVVLHGSQVSFTFRDVHCERLEFSIIQFGRNQRSKLPTLVTTGVVEKVCIYIHKEWPYCAL